MKLYYSTYGMKQQDIFTALPRLAAMGYEGMEIAVTPAGRRNRPSWTKPPASNWPTFAANWVSPPRR